METLCRLLSWVSALGLGSSCMRITPIRPAHACRARISAARLTSSFTPCGSTIWFIFILQFYSIVFCANVEKISLMWRLCGSNVKKIQLISRQVNHKVTQNQHNTKSQQTPHSGRSETPTALLLRVRCTKGYDCKHTMMTAVYTFALIINQVYMIFINTVEASKPGFGFWLFHLKSAVFYFNSHLIISEAKRLLSPDCLTPLCCY